MHAVKAIKETVRAAEARGDHEAVDAAFKQRLAEPRALRDDVAEARARLTRDARGALRPGTVAAWFCGLRLAVAQLNWRTRARDKAAELRLAALEERLAAVEARVDEGLEYLGTHQHGEAYRRNACVTYDGNIWISRRETRQRPGDGPDWQLAVRKGRDAFR